MKLKIKMFLLLLLVCGISSLQAADFSYSEDFTGTVGSQPTDWFNYSSTSLGGTGDIDIQQDLLDASNYVYAGQTEDTFTGSYYQNADANDWVNYTLEVDFQQTWSYPSTTGTASYLFSAVTFRNDGPLRGYILRVRKLLGTTVTHLMLGYYDTSDTLTFPDDVDIVPIAQAEMVNALAPNVWYTYTVDVNGNNIHAQIAERGSIFVEAEINAVDTRLVKGSVGVYSAMNSSNYSEFDNVIVDGNTDLTCEMVLGAYALTADMNQDCYVDLKDFAVMAEDWAKCIDAGDPTCIQPWNPQP